ncbi:hypothetical protein pb186bvf_004707 [Paramecium bursaria]
MIEEIQSRRLPPISQAQKRISKDSGDRRSSYNIEGYDNIEEGQSKDKEDNFIKILAASRLLDYATIVLVVMYILLVFINFSFTSNDASNDWQIAQTLFITEIIELCILSLFCVEISLRIYALTPTVYYSDHWNKFDTLIILISMAMIILDFTINDSNFSTASKILRGIFRFLRLFLVFRKFNQVKKISNINTRYNVRSPIEKVLEILRDLLEQFEDPDIVKEIKYSIEQISNNTLYEPIVDEQTNKIDALQWITKARRSTQQDKIDIKQIGEDNDEESIHDLIPIPQIRIQDFNNNITDLAYDYFKLYEEIKNDMLTQLLIYLFGTHNLFSSLHINFPTFKKVAEQISQGYFDNQYHNVIHAFDVTHTVYFFLQTCDFKNIAKLSNLDLAIMFISAAAHDLQHPGKNNLFLNHTRDPLAIKYNDRSPLENHHASTLFMIIRQNDLLSGISLTDYKYFRERTVTMILSTDNALHGKDFNKLKARLASTDFDPINKDKGICMDALLHGADISNPFKPWNNYYAWTIRVLEEFWQQGDREKELGLPISMLCDRKTTNTAKSQIGFIDFMSINVPSKLGWIYTINSGEQKEMARLD